jgi:predicted RNA binding protein with dsRBD fold (UPF0201 family)
VKVKVSVEAEINPTEDVQKVYKAVEHVFEGSLKVNIDNSGYGFLKGDGDRDTLNKIKDLIIKHYIRDAAKSYLTSHIQGDQLIFFLNKQVAYKGHISFCEPEGESPLGPIKFELSTEDPLKIIDWLTKK